MTPVDPRLHDFLKCAAIAVDAAESGNGVKADSAWLEAHASAEGLFEPGTAGDAAVGVILRASAPDQGSQGRASLWNALDAVAKAALAAMDGRPNLRGVNMNGAAAAVSALPGGGPERKALSVILAAVARMPEVTA